jgi:hypothetical protein
MLTEDLTTKSFNSKAGGFIVSSPASSGLWLRVALWEDTNVSEVHAASIFMVK